MTPSGTRSRGTPWVRARVGLRLVGPWALALLLMAVAVPRTVGVSWPVLLAALSSVRWTAVVALLGVWLLGLYAHSFLLVSSATGLTRRRALLLNVASSTVAGLAPFGGAAGLEVNRRMMRAWGVDGRAFSGYALLITVWNVACKLVLPSVAVVAVAVDDEHVLAPLSVAAVGTGVLLVALVGAGAAVLVSPRAAARGAGVLETVCCRLLRACRSRREPALTAAVVGVRDDCAALVRRGWLAMASGVVGYAAFQCLLLGLCLHLTSAGSSGPEVLAGFAVERTLTVMPITPGGMGVGDIGLVGMLLASGGNPVGVAAGAVLFRAFLLAVEVPVGACVLAAWLVRGRIPAGRKTRKEAGLDPGVLQTSSAFSAATVSVEPLQGVRRVVDEVQRPWPGERQPEQRPGTAG